MDFGDHSELTEKIIGCAFRVYGILGFGFLESVYEKSLAIEFEKVNLPAEFQKPIAVAYEGRCVGNFVADIFVDGKIIVELKSVKTLNRSHEIQLVNYLAATRTAVGLLLNFGENTVEVKRKLWQLPKIKGFDCNPVNPVNPV